ncbi:hypothetical protein N431DRAFT_467857 [Stipitochalara longipes BDJ]|nr:hypothetical protein N431DRAFT_467857 [Stipitochalara longipes BDJ]
MAEMPSSRRSRDLYRTPSPPRTPPRVRRKAGNIEDYGFTATKLYKSYQPRRSLKNAMAAAELRHTSPRLESGLSTPGSICLVPSLSTTPNSVRSLEQIPTPKIPRGINLLSKKLKSDSPSLFSNNDVGTTFSEWHVEFPTSQVWKRSISTSQNATTLPKDAIQGQRISQPSYEVDHPDSPRHNVVQPMAGPATPKRQVMRLYDSQARSLAKLAKKDEKMRSQCTRQPLSMWSIVASVVLLQRYVKGQRSRQGKSPSYREKATVIRDMLQESTSTVLISKNASVSSWILQSEDSNSSSDTCSVDFLESDATEHDFEAGEFWWCGNEIDTQIIHRERRVVFEDIMELAQHALSHLPQVTMTKTLAAVRVLFESWASQLTSSTYAAEGDTSSSFNFSQAGGNSERTTSNSRSQKRPLDEEDEQPPNNGDNNTRKRQNLYGTLDGECRPMWACPFYRREPHRYCDITELGDFRKCAKSPGFPELHRVKGHLQKCHSSPIYCKRCYAVVKNDKELETHQIKIPACDVKPRQRIEGLTSEQKTLLQTRDRSKSEEERWKAIYKICFPDDEVIPSPYYVHYSREVVELRRDILEIIRAEAQSPGEFDVGRLLQRVEATFNTQQSAHAEAPGILTPSTSDTSHTSNTSGGLSNRATTREICQGTPSVTRTSRRLASATGCDNALQVPDINELDEPSDSAMTNDGTSMSLYTSHFSGSNNFPAFDQANEYAPVHFRGFGAPMPQLDSDPYQIDQEYYDFHDFDIPQPNLDSILNL